MRIFTLSHPEKEYIGPEYLVALDLQDAENYLKKINWNGSIIEDVTENCLTWKNYNFDLILKQNITGILIFGLYNNIKTVKIDTQYPTENENGNK